ncbi:MAG: DUF1823 family protein [Pegethrix bostrychoides GSE-TBD4-15B]|jgi:hypothetical protein|uniref:DUF1823 family protein n=1 Tax=Pegethrix bostrychoides GSE-TBD4-15B TaxID=2839662 RepID=A0A951U8H0_9CYAN|nr:DUF1823 family protein [Pegethrix bostrychoides GSE-TBD4-15B]
MSELLPPLTDDTLWQILNEQLDDTVVNQLVWFYLGYRPAQTDSAQTDSAQTDSAQTGWDLAAVSPDWAQDYPEPPDFIASRPATVKLTRSIPKEHKQLLKEELGFAGYKINELVPRKTRRATMVNWLLSYRQGQP